MKAPLGGTVIAYIIVCLGPISRRKRLNVHPAQPVLSYPKWVDGPRISPGKGHPRLVRIMYGCGPKGWYPGRFLCVGHTDKHPHWGATNSQWDWKWAAPKESLISLFSSGLICIYFIFTVYFFIFIVRRN